MTRKAVALALTAVLLTPTAAHAHHEYTVKSGDTLSRIAARKDTPGGWRRLAYRNRGRVPNPNVIHVGQRLWLPHKPSPIGPRRTPSTSRSAGTRVESTAYCLTGTMANGQRAHTGAVAMNGVPFGTRYTVTSGPLAGQTLTVKDRIGHGSQFDIAMPGRCGDARAYGRRVITVERR